MKALLILLLFLGVTVSAQTPKGTNIVSPEVLADRRVIFRVNAPKATEVGLFGDWMKPNTLEPMRRDEQGIWTVTAGPLEPGLAIYTVTIDGVTTPDPVNPRIKLRARTSASLVDVPGNPPELWQARPVPHGTIEINWSASTNTADTRAYQVYTPPGYVNARYHSYPVLYLLHGNNDTASGWTDVGKANFIFDNLIAEKKVVPMVVVMPWGHALPYDGPQTNNAATFERYLIDEVMPQVEAKYRVRHDRLHRAIVGLSMGGGQAMQIGLGHLELFSSVGALSSAVPSSFETRFKALLEEPAKTNAKLKLFWIGCGRQDGAFEKNEKLSALLTEHKISHTFHPTEGLHNFAIWRKYLVEVAPLLFRN